MKKLPLLPLTLALALMLAPTARADVISAPGIELLAVTWHDLPLILILVALLVTILLVRHFTKR